MWRQLSRPRSLPLVTLMESPSLRHGKAGCGVAPNWTDVEYHHYRVWVTVWSRRWDKRRTMDRRRGPLLASQTKRAPAHADASAVIERNHEPLHSDDHGDALLASASTDAQTLGIARGASRRALPAPADNFTAGARVETLFEALDPSDASGGTVTFEAGPAPPGTRIPEARS